MTRTLARRALDSRAAAVLLDSLCWLVGLRIIARRNR